MGTLPNYFLYFPDLRKKVMIAMTAKNMKRRVVRKTLSNIKESKNMWLWSAGVSKDIYKE